MVVEFGPKCPATVTVCPAPTVLPWAEEEEAEEEPEGLLALEVEEVEDHPY